MLMQMHSPRQKGFTLIEIMIVVAIIGILAAIALPSYQNSIRKSKRQVAISDMLAYKQAQERYRTNNLTYGTLAQISAAPYGFTVSSKTTDYTFDITGITASAYTITATASASQAPAGSVEASCTPLTLTHDDVRGPNASVCWAR